MFELPDLIQQETDRLWLLTNGLDFIVLLLCVEYD